MEDEDLQAPVALRPWWAECNLRLRRGLSFLVQYLRSGVGASAVQGERRCRRGSGTQEAGEASSSTARAGVPGHPGAGQPATLPADRFAVEWWLASQAVTGAGLPYATDGVLDLWPGRRAETDRWTFGLELEFAVADAGWVATELHALGLCASPEPAPYHAPRSGGLWVVEQDRSVSTVFESPDGGAPIVVGGEVISPPLRDTPETWAQVASVLEVLRSAGRRSIAAAGCTSTSGRTPCARPGTLPGPATSCSPSPAWRCWPTSASRTSSSAWPAPRAGSTAGSTSTTATAGPWSAPCWRRTRT